MVVNVHDQLAIVGGERLGIDRKVEAWRARPDETRDGLDAGIGEQLLLDPLEILGHGVDSRAFGQAVVEQELRHRGIRKEQLGYLAKAGYRRDEQPGRGHQREDPVANGGFERGAKSTLQPPGRRIAALCGGGAQELHALQRRDSH